MRMEVAKEVRIYCEGSGWGRDSNGGRGMIVTEGPGRMMRSVESNLIIGLIRSMLEL